MPNNRGSNSNYSMSTEKTELLSPDTCSTVTTEDTKLELDELVAPPLIPPRTSNRKETTFVNTEEDKRPAAAAAANETLHSERPSTGIQNTSQPVAGCSDDNSGEKSKAKSSEQSKEVILEPSSVLNQVGQPSGEQQPGVTRYVNV